MAVQLRKLSHRHNPQRSYKWRVAIQDFHEVLPPELIQDCSIPVRANESNPVHQGGTNDYYPSFVDISSLTLTFIENDLGLVSTALEDWKQLVQMPNELFNYSNLYKKIVFCDLLDNINNVHTRYVLTGVWPASASPTVLDYTSSDVWRISQEFSVDGGEVLPGIGRRASIPRAVPIIGGL